MVLFRAAKYILNDRKKIYFVQQICICRIKENTYCNCKSSVINFHQVLYNKIVQAVRIILTSCEEGTYVHTLLICQYIYRVYTYIIIQSFNKMSDTVVNVEQSPSAVSASPATNKKTAAASKNVAAAKKPRVKASHPPTAEMVNTAIKSLKERGGSSLQAIKKYLTSYYKIDAEKSAPFIKKYIKSAVTSGQLIQTKGKGASGSFKLAAKESASSASKVKSLSSGSANKKTTSSKGASEKKSGTAAKSIAGKKSAVKVKKVSASKKTLVDAKKTTEKKKVAATKVSVAKKTSTVKSTTVASAAKSSKQKPTKATKSPAKKPKTPKPKKVTQIKKTAAAPKKLPAAAAPKKK